MPRAGGVGKTDGSGVINAVFTDKKDNSQMKSSDFLKLFVAQMQNQDFTKPMDNSEMMNQITQFSNMQMMQEMAMYSKSNYAMSLVGKNVTASRFAVGGKLDTVTGPVEKVSLVDGEYVFYVSGKKFTLEQIMEVQTAGGAGSPGIDTGSSKLVATEVTNNSATLKWDIPTEDEIAAKKLKYSLYYSQEGPFNSVESVEKGKIVGIANQGSFNKETIKGLDPSTAYFVNVVVTDANGNKSVYKPTMVLTKN
ncbi:MAG: flagellar hook capping FlgD N-terminal domain-containing protein [Oscillospiraceae bacterium]